MLGKVKIRKQVDVLEKIIKLEEISSEYDNITLEELRCALAVLVVRPGEVDINKTFSRFSAVKERRMEEINISEEMDDMDADDDEEQDDE